MLAQQGLARGVQQADLALGGHHDDGVLDGAQDRLQPAVQHAAPLPLAADQIGHCLAQPVDGIGLAQARRGQRRA